MILNILLTIVLFFVFFRIITTQENYQNPFDSIEYPMIDKNKLVYTPPPYLPNADSPSLILLESQRRFIEKNNKLMLEYADDSNYTIDDPKIIGVKLIYPMQSKMISKDMNNYCLDSINNSISMKPCENKDQQKWSLINDHLSVMIGSNTTKCVSYDNLNNVTLNDCSANDVYQQWIPDSKNRIHNIDDYSKCLDVNNKSKTLTVNYCQENTLSQTWTAT